MPRVPKLDQLEISARGLPNVAFTPVEAHTHNITRLPDLNRQARTRSPGGGAHLGTGGVHKVELNHNDAAWQAAKQAGALQQNIARGISNLGLTIQEIALQERAKADAARLQDAQNQYLRAQLDLEYGEDGWRSRRGEAAMPSGDKRRTLDDEYDQRINNSYQQISQSLGNDRQREMFRQWADGQRLQQRGKIRSHVMREFEGFKENTYKARKELAAEMVMRGDTERGISLLQENNARYAAENGLPPEWLQAANKSGLSREIGSYIGTMIEGGDLEGAAVAIKQYSQYLDGETTAKQAKNLQTAVGIREAMQAAQEEISSWDTEIDQARPGDYYARYNTGFNRARAKAKLFTNESSGKNNAKNPDSSAYGKAQFIKETWDAFGKSDIGKQIRGEIPLGSKEWYEMRSNPMVSEIATDWYFDHNRAILSKHGIPWNDATAYLSHVAGAKGAVAIYKEPPGMNAGEALRKAGIKNWQSMVKFNQPILGGTTEKAMQVIAAKMGVTPTTSPAGQVEEVDPPTKASLLAKARQLAPDDPIRQKAYFDLVNNERELREEQTKAENNAAYTQTYVAVKTGSGIGSVPADVLNKLNPKQIVDLSLTAEEIEERTLKKQHTKFRLDALKLSREPEQLMKMSQEEIYSLYGAIGEDNVKTLLKAWDNMHSDKGIENMYKLQPRMLDSLIEKAYGNKYIQDKNKKDEIANVRYFAQGEWLRILNGMIDQGEAITEEKLLQYLEDSLRLQTEIEESHWYGNKKKSYYVAQLPPWQQVQYHARQRFNLKLATGQAIDTDSVSSGYEPYDGDYRFNEGNDSATRDSVTSDEASVIVDKPGRVQLEDLRIFI